MPIENRDLKAGTKLVAKYHKTLYRAEVLEGENGKVRYKLEDGREFKSSSAAGMAITNKACNGWAFWSVETALTTPAQPTETSQTSAENTPAAANTDAAAPPAPTPQEAAPVATEPAAPAKKPFFKLPNQKGAPEGQTRWFCKECGKSYLAPAGETPKTCPQGHGA